MTDLLTPRSAAAVTPRIWREIDDRVPRGALPCHPSHPAGHDPRRAPRTLAFLAAATGTLAVHLGVTAFGPSGDLDTVYRHHGLDPDTIVRAALDALHR